MENKRDDAVQAQVVTKKVSIRELTKQLEVGELNPGTLGKKVLRQCALYFKTHGYSTEEIAEILGCNIRTVQRYTRGAIEANMFNIDSRFQCRIAEEFINNWKLQYQRLLKLSYSEDLLEVERAKIIYALHKLDVDRITTLEHMGYISQTHGIEDVKTTTRETEIIRSKIVVKSTLDILHKNKKLIEEFKGS